MRQALRRMQMLYMLISSIIIVGVSLLISIFVISQADWSMKNQASSLIAADTRQLELNIDNYLNEVEKITTLLFSDDSYYGYDATDSSLDEYDRIQAANRIRERVIDLGLMRNFSDFGIVYGDGQTAGWISQVTKAAFSDGGLYDEFAPVVRGNRKEQGWAYGVRGNFDRLYYAKRLNDNAIVVASFYGNELEKVFDIPEELSELTIRLTAGDDTILYSSDNSEISGKLPLELADRLDGRTNLSVMDDAFLVTSYELYNGWKVVCSEPTSAVLRDNRLVRQRLWIIALITAAIALLLMNLTNRRLNRSMGSMVENLRDRAAEDQMTGLLNKTAFMGAVRRQLEEPVRDGDMAVFVMFDLDNFKQVNDHLGHICGDRVIRLMSAVMKEELSGDLVLGRIGGDEFAAFAMTAGQSRDAAEQWILPQAERVLSSFEHRAAALLEDCARGAGLSGGAGADGTDANAGVPEAVAGLSVSAGVLVAQSGEFTADELYQRTDAALYVSKRTGKSRVTVI